MNQRKITYINLFLNHTLQEPTLACDDDPTQGKSSSPTQPINHNPVRLRYHPGLRQPGSLHGRCHITDTHQLPSDRWLRSGILTLSRKSAPRPYLPALIPLPGSEACGKSQPT